MEISKLRQAVNRLSKDRYFLEKECMNIRFMIKGTLLLREKYCLKPGCKCTRGEPHPPLTYLSKSVGGKTYYRYIKKRNEYRVKKGVDNYHRYQKSLQRIREIDREIENLLNQIRDGQLKEV